MSDGPQVMDQPDYPHDCTMMLDAVERSSSPIFYSAKVREFGVHDDERTELEEVYIFEFCPFCGVALPASLRDEFFARVEAIDPDADPFTTASLPLAFRDDTWWRSGQASAPGTVGEDRASRD